jgi:glycosyltransferase involved in cell wall biosynthesis
MRVEPQRTRDGHPRVSVVIPAWNRADFLPEALDSVLAQSHAVDEIVVVDDGSTDATAEVAASYAGRGVRCLHQENRGVSAARNRGMQETTGTWIAFLDADDVWEPRKIEWQLQWAQTAPDVVLVSGHAWFWDVSADVRTLKTFGWGHRDPRREIAVRNTIGNTSLVLLRRDVMQQLGGFDPRLRFGEDWEMWIRVLDHGAAAIVPRPLMLYRWHADSNSRFRDWRRYDVLSQISKQAIQRTRPAWRRGVLHLRRLATLHAGRAAFAVERQRSRRLQVVHAVLALGLYPFEETRSRCGTLLHACLGTRLYRSMSASARTTAAATRASGRASSDQGR